MITRDPRAFSLRHQHALVPPHPPPRHTTDRSKTRSRSRTGQKGVDQGGLAGSHAHHGSPHEALGGRHRPCLAFFRALRLNLGSTAPSAPNVEGSGDRRGAPGSCGTPRTFGRIFFRPPTQFAAEAPPALPERWSDGLVYWFRGWRADGQQRPARVALMASVGIQEEQFDKTLYASLRRRQEDRPTKSRRHYNAANTEARHRVCRHRQRPDNHRGEGYHNIFFFFFFVPTTLPRPAFRTTPSPFVF